MLEGATESFTINNYISSEEKDNTGSYRCQFFEQETGGLHNVR